MAALLDALAAQPPEVILLGDQLEPGMDVLALVERVRQAAPRARLLVMGSLPDGLIVQELLICGVAGYLYKSDSLSSCLPEALRVVLRGRPYLSPTANAEYLLAVQAGRAGGSWTPKDARCCVSAQASPAGNRLMRRVSVRRIYSVCERLRRRFDAKTNEHLIARAAEGFLP